MKQSPVLATDLDGTLIPLNANLENREDLRRLSDQLVKSHATLVFVTGRHLASVRQVMEDAMLPAPNYILCDVGTSIYQFAADVASPVLEYKLHLTELVRRLGVAELSQSLDSISELTLQEDEKQGEFKLSYYVPSEKIETIVARVQTILTELQAPYSIIHSIDPFNGDGLIDLLPVGVSKAYALDWWSDYAGYQHQQVVFAGDSGNDLAAFTSGYRSIVVGNADRSLANAVKQQHAQEQWVDRLYLAKKTATSGVLEGCEWFRVFEK